MKSSAESLARGDDNSRSAPAQSHRPAAPTDWAALERAELEAAMDAAKPETVRCGAAVMAGYDAARRGAGPDANPFARTDGQPGAGNLMRALAARWETGFASGWVARQGTTAAETVRPPNRFAGTRDREAAARDARRNARAAARTALAHVRPGPTHAALTAPDD